MRFFISIFIGLLMITTSCRQLPKESMMDNNEEMSEISQQIQRQANQAEQKYYKAEAEFNAAVENGSLRDRTDALKAKKEAQQEWEEIKKSVK